MPTKVVAKCQGFSHVPYYDEISTLAELTVGLNVVLQVLLLFCRIYASQMHSVEPAILLSLVPIRL